MRGCGVDHVDCAPRVHTTYQIAPAENRDSTLSRISPE
jgi:hypothetical protein